MPKQREIRHFRGTFDDAGNLTSLADGNGRTFLIPANLVLDGSGNVLGYVNPKDGTTVAFGSGGASNWGSIGGTLANQTDLANTLAAKQGAGAFIALTDGASIAVNAASGNNFKVTLGGNRTLSNPTGLVDGQTYTFEITQDATGGRTLAFDTLFKFSSGSLSSLNLASNAVSTISAKYSSGSGILSTHYITGSVSGGGTTTSVLPATASRNLATSDSADTGVLVQAAAGITLTMPISINKPITVTRKNTGFTLASGDPSVKFNGSTASIVFGSGAGYLAISILPTDVSNEYIVVGS